MTISLPQLIFLGRISVFSLAGLILAGCAALQPQADVKSEILTTNRAIVKSVAVVASPLMTNSVTSTRLTELIHNELNSIGIKVTESPTEADLVLVIAFTRTSVTDDPSLSSTNVPLPEVSLISASGFSSPGMMQTPSSLSTNSAPRWKAGLIVTAIPKQNWQNSNGDGSGDKAWRVIASITQYERRQDVLSALVTSCGPDLKMLINPTAH